MGAPAGAIYDLSARLYARHIAKFIPGAPQVVVQNMPGAAGIRAANFLFNAAPADGGTIALALDNLVLSQFLAPDEAKYRAERFQWIGRGDRPTRVTYAWSASGLRSLDDARKREVLTGVTAPGTSSEVYPMLANSLLGARFKLISGYEGAGGLNLALERGEIEAVGANSWVNLQITKPEWIQQGKIRPLFQTSLERDVDLADTPTMLELADTDARREVIRFHARSEEIGFYVIAPPNAPADRVEILRKAFTDMTRDAAYLADAKSGLMGTKAQSGREMQMIVEAVAATPPEVVARFKQAIAAPR